MPRRHSFFMLLQATSAWRALDAQARDAHHEAMLMRIFDGYPDLTLRRFEGASMGSHCSDVLWWETSDLAQYHEAVQSLRDARLLGAPWFEVLDVIPAVEQSGDEQITFGYLTSVL